MGFKAFLSTFLNASGTELALKTIIMNIVLTFILSFILFIVYKLTYSGVAYSKSFNVSIVMTTMTTAIVMMVIGGNLALSLGMVGALSIVRFRTAVKEPKDIAYLFWGLSIGLSAGTGAYGLAFVGTLAMTLVVFLFHFSFSDSSISYLLVIKGQNLQATDITGKVKLLTKKYKIKMQNTTMDLTEYVYEVKITQDTEQAIVNAFKEIEGVQIVNVVAYNGNISG